MTGMLLNAENRVILIFNDINYLNLCTQNTVPLFVFPLICVSINKGN